MRKVFLGILMIIFGTFSLGAKQSAESVVKVRATLVSEELVVEGANKKPLVLDLGKGNGNLDFCVQYTGVKNTANSVSQVEFKLTNSNIELVNENSNTTLNSNIQLNKNVQMLANKNSQVTGSIQGKIQGINSNTAKGMYTGVTQLNITVIPM